MAGSEIPEDVPPLTPVERALIKALSTAILDEIREAGGITNWVTQQGDSAALRPRSERNEDEGD